MNPDDLAQLNNQISAMAQAGLPLDTGLGCLARDMGPGKLRAVTRELADDLHRGVTLPEALARHDKDLPPFYAGLVQAGIRTGRLAEVLQTLTTYARSISLTRWIIVESLLYPAVILVLAVVLFSGVTYFLLPLLAKPLVDFKMQLPATTRVMLRIGENLPWIVGLPAVGLSVLFLLARWYLRRSPAGREQWTRFIYSLPLLGSLIRAARLAAYVELLAIMVEHEVPLHEAIQRAGLASSDPLLESQSRTIHDQLVQGRKLGEILRGHGLLPEWVAWMTLAGERQGTLASTLRQVAENYRRQVDARAAVLRSVLPPVLILVTAGVIGIAFILTLAIPLIRMMNGLVQ